MASKKKKHRGTTRDSKNGARGDGSTSKSFEYGKGQELDYTGKRKEPVICTKHER